MFERQNIIAAAAVLVLVAVAAWLRPDPSPSFHAEISRVAVAERELLNRYRDASLQFKAGEIDDPQFAAIIERDVLGPYAAVRREIEGLKSHPDADHELFAQIGRFDALRVESWRLLVEALREQDQEKLQEHERKWNEADTRARKLMLPRDGRYAAHV